MSQTIPVTATILVKNAQRYLIPVLNALHAFDEVLLLDNGSTDCTLTIAQRYPNVRIYHHDFDGFGPMKNRASRLARNDWIFNIDSDEIPTEKLLNAIYQIDFSQTHIVYHISRLNHYRGRPIRGCWYPDIIPRLYHRQYTQFNSVAVHERIQIPEGSQSITLDGELLHYSVDGVDALINKMQTYSHLNAQAHYQHKKVGLGTAIVHGLSMFFKNYLIKQGFRYGRDGFVISLTNALGSFYKYVKMYEYANQPPFPAGSRVQHQKYGVGTVLQVQPLYIAFDDGKQMVMAEHDSQLELLR